MKRKKEGRKDLEKRKNKGKKDKKGNQVDRREGIGVDKRNTKTVNMIKEKEGGKERLGEKRIKERKVRMEMKWTGRKRQKETREIEKQKTG